MNLGAITYFAVLRGQKVFYLCSAYPHKKDNHFPYRTIIGETAPLYCTSLGKVMMAFMPSEELEAYLTQSVSFHTLYTIYHNRAGPAETGSRLDSRKRL